MRELYRLIKKAIILRVIDKQYQKELKSYQKLTNFLKENELDEDTSAGIVNSRNSAKDDLNKLLDASINFRLIK